MAEPAMPVRLVATDLDGTLLRPDGTVSNRTAEAVRAARGLGLHVVPVTGRPPRATWEVAHNAGLGPLGVCANGAAIVDLPAMEVVELETIEAGLAASVVEGLRRRFPGVVFAVEQSHCLAYEPGFFEAERLWEDLSFEVEDIVAALSLATVKLIVRRPGCAAADLLAHLSGDAARPDRAAGLQLGATAYDPVTGQTLGRMDGSSQQLAGRGASTERAGNWLAGSGLSGQGFGGGSDLARRRSADASELASAARPSRGEGAGGGRTGKDVASRSLQQAAREQLARFSVTSSGLDWVELAAEGISKAYGTWRLCQRLGIDRTEVLAIGDYYNDLPLLGWAGRTAAPANALPEVLAAAQLTIPSNAEDGVAQLLEELVAGASP